jgi:hypothetical protein
MMAQANFEAIAGEVIASLNNHSQIPTFSSRPGGITLGRRHPPRRHHRSVCLTAHRARRESHVII